MRVLIDAVSAPGDPRGVGRYVRGLVSSLAMRTDVVPIVAHGRWHLQFFDPLWRSGVASIPVDLRANGRLARHAWHTVGLPRLARRMNADIVHLTDRTPPGPSAGPPTVLAVHDVAEHDCPEAFGPLQLRYRRLILGRQLRRAAWFVTPSAFTANRLAELDPAARSRTTVAPLGPGLDPATEPERPPMPELPSFLLYVGSMQRHKNVPRIVHAFRRLENEQVSLVLAGADHNARDEVTRAIDGDRRIVRLSAATDAHLAWLYTHAVGLILASLYEGFGLPVLEAMSLGCPVIAADIAGTQEVADGAALLVDPLDEAAIHRAMVRLLDDPQLRERLTTLGRQRATELSWAGAAAGTVDAYRAALKPSE